VGAKSTVAADDGARAVPSSNVATATTMAASAIGPARRTDVRRELVSSGRPA
jgi:hypothetical protein